MKKLTVFTAALMFAGLTLAQTQGATPAKTRAQVTAELQQARESGELAAMNSEVGPNSVLTVGQRSATAFAAKPAAKKLVADKDAAKPAAAKAEVASE